MVPGEDVQGLETAAKEELVDVVQLAQLPEALRGSCSTGSGRAGTGSLPHREDDAGTCCCSMWCSTSSLLSGSASSTRSSAEAAAWIRPSLQRRRGVPAGAVVFIDEPDAAGGHGARGAGDGRDSRARAGTRTSDRRKLDGSEARDRGTATAPAALRTTSTTSTRRASAWSLRRRGTGCACDLGDGREAIFRSDARDKTLSDTVDPTDVACKTTGLMGVQLGERAQRGRDHGGGRGGPTSIAREDLDEALPAAVRRLKQNMALYSNEERWATAADYEAGHASC